MFRLSEYAKREHAFQDVLRYGFPLGNGVIALKLGGFLRSYAFRGRDHQASSWEELESRASRLSSHLRALDDDWVIDVDAFRIPAREYPRDGYWPDRLTWLLDQARRVNYEGGGAAEHFETRFVITVSYYPKAIDSGRLASFQRWIKNRMHDAERPLDPGFEENLARFIGATDQMGGAIRGEELFHAFEPLGVLEAVNTAGRPIVFDETLSYLGYCVSGEFFPVALIEDEPMFADAIVSEDVVPGWDLKVRDHYVGVVQIEQFPGYSYPGILQILAELPSEYRWNQKFIPMSQEQGEARLAWLKRAWSLASLGGFGFLSGGLLGKATDPVAAQTRNDVEAAQLRARSGERQYGHYSTRIIVRAKTVAERDRLTQMLCSKIQAVEGFKARVLKEDAIEGFIASLPGERDACEYREQRLNSRHVGHMLPLSAQWAGPVEHPNRRFGEGAPPVLWTTTTGATPFRLSTYHGEVGHTLVIGGTGGGKSFLMWRIITAHLARYRNARAFMFDNGYSGYKATQLCGGYHYDVALDSPPQLAPLTGFREPERRREILEWIRELYEQYQPMTAEQVGHVNDALRSLADIQETASLSDLATMVQDTKIAQVLEPYQESFLDASRDDLDFRRHFGAGHSPLVTIEYGRLGHRQTKWTSPFIRYVERRIWDSLSGEGVEPTILAFDEGQYALKIPRLQEFIDDVERRARKYLGQLLFGTQEVTDITGSDIGMAMVNLCPVKIFCANPAALTDKNASAYRDVGLTNEAIALLATMDQFTFLYVSPAGIRVFSLEPTSVELVMLAQASPEDKALVDAALREDPLNPAAAYMKQRIAGAAGFAPVPELIPYLAAFEQVRGQADLSTAEVLLK